ncbi:MAG: Phosphoenolpyruvate-protein phosphotransferase [Syntrophaceae bacterium PtaB.Bin095]|jgi:phosphotransferase system enzyme I (PtsI)|nr:MAG: Phosphoenolpyruvate-protein phosphotransferase [Syntrophaceae bacterium PtaB.Bin095]
MTDPVKKTFVLKGIGVSPGIVIGKAYLFDRLDTQISVYKLDDCSLIPPEIERFRTALQDSEKQLLGIKKKLIHLKVTEPQYIIDVHLMILKDRKFVNRTIQYIKKIGVNAEWALRMTLDRYRQIFDRVEDEYLKGRFSDIRYVGQMILRNLGGKQCEVRPPIGEGVVIIATDLSPADTAQMKIEKVQGFATDIGGKTSHTAIVARSIEIPAVVGLENITRRVRTNDLIIIDGSAGLVIVNPEPEIVRRYEVKKRHHEETREISLKDALLPTITRDGHHVEIGGNIEFIEEIPSVISHGADGIGLYRTEFIYINREQLPSEEDHFSIYRRVVETEKLNWSTIRTFDLGGDKFLSDPKLAKEMNPQMGLRAIRFCLKEVDLFKVQLRAIIRASAYGKTRVLFPMISGIEEIQRAKQIFREVREDLAKQGLPVGEDIEIGVMIEVPSAVVMADQLAREVDFFSIGTNDLIQYALAIDRVNERVTYLYEPLHPAVLRLIQRVVKTGHDAGIRVAMCGEMAGEAAYTMVLLGLELDELSMNPLAIPRVKKIIRGSTMKEARALLKKVMTFATATEIRAWVGKTMQERFPEEFPNSEH